MRAKVLWLTWDVWQVNASRAIPESGVGRGLGFLYIPSKNTLPSWMSRTTMGVSVRTAPLGTET
jgi:hypothetical protein